MVTCLLLATALLAWPGSVGVRPVTAAPVMPVVGPPEPEIWRRSPTMAVLLGISLAMLVAWWTDGLIVATSAAMFLTTAALLVRSERRRRAGHRELADMLAAGRTLGREIRAGAAPLAAIRVSAGARHGPSARMLADLAVVVVGGRGQVGRVGQPPGRAGVTGRKRRNRPDPVAEISARLARGWQLSARYGVPLAVLVDTVSEDLAGRLAASAERDAQVSGPRVSGYVLAAMPALGVLLGMGMGADPLHVLFSTGPGRLMLLAGTTLTCAGLAWTARIVRG